MKINQIKKWKKSGYFHHDHQQRVVIVVMLLNDGHTHTASYHPNHQDDQWLTIDDGDVDNRFEMMIIFLFQKSIFLPEKTH